MAVTPPSSAYRKEVYYAQKKEKTFGGNQLLAFLFRYDGCSFVDLCVDHFVYNAAIAKTLRAKTRGIEAATGFGSKPAGTTAGAAGTVRQIDRHSNGTDRGSQERV